MTRRPRQKMHARVAYSFCCPAVGQLSLSSPCLSTCPRLVSFNTTLCVLTLFPWTLTRGVILSRATLLLVMTPPRRSILRTPPYIKLLIRIFVNKQRFVSCVKNLYFFARPYTWHDDHGITRHKNQPPPQGITRQTKHTRDPPPSRRLPDHTHTCDNRSRVDG